MPPWGPSAQHATRAVVRAAAAGAPRGRIAHGHPSPSAAPPPPPHRHHPTPPVRRASHTALSSPPRRREGLATTADSFRMAKLVENFRTNGHFVANLDPLSSASPIYGADANRLDQLLRAYPVRAGGEVKARWVKHMMLLDGDPREPVRLRGLALNFDTDEHVSPLEVIEDMRAAYCGTLSMEFMHLRSKAEQRWLAKRCEKREPLSRERHAWLARHLLRAHVFETFLAAQFPSVKRFGLDGCEALLPGLHALVRESALKGVRRIEMGMAHRGRLNVLYNLGQKEYAHLFNEMRDQHAPYQLGDVKYHMGNLGSVSVEGREVAVSLAPNPSHLEAINPVVLGMVKAQQERVHGGVSTVLPLLIHGDAAFAALGQVPETLHLSQLDRYSVGGCVHVVVNNQIGFTTTPLEGCSFRHPTCVAKPYDIPVIHVNSSDVPAVHDAFTIAADFRATFFRDVVVNLVGYRRYGHNELDDPSVTLPRLYDEIRRRPSVVDIYSEELVDQGILTRAELADMSASHLALCHKAAENREQETFKEFMAATWQGSALKSLEEERLREHGSIPDEPDMEPTGNPFPTLNWCGEAITTIPDGFSVHPAVAKILKARHGMVQDADSRVDLAMAEQLAFAVLSLRKQVLPPDLDSVNPDEYFQPFLGLNRRHFHIRLSGQDSERGTFNQRHATVYDQQTGNKREVLSHISDHQGQVDIFNSPLAEMAPLGFEYGYSLLAKDTLVVWEAQFGDFANNAQTIIDTFIASGEEKWGQDTALVMMLPHGYSGLGPDHSSARLERFLSLSNDELHQLSDNSSRVTSDIDKGFRMLSDDMETIKPDQIAQLLVNIDIDTSPDDVISYMYQDLNIEQNQPIPEAAWKQFMARYLRRSYERHANLLVANVTTPAQLYHLLRFQLNRGHRKPLALLTAKWLHNHRQCTSPLSDFFPGTHFRRIIVDGMPGDNCRHLHQGVVANESIRRVIICTGQIYYVLLRARNSNQIKDIVFIRLEQIAPFPYDLMMSRVADFPNAELVWCQEEPANMGAWNYVKPRMTASLPDEKGSLGAKPQRGLTYVGRPAQASSATASMNIHFRETQDIVNRALLLNQHET